MSYRIKAKLDHIQCPFLLNITRAYRTTPTNALQVISGIMPLHLKLEAEANFIRVTCLRHNVTIDGEELLSENYEEKASGWSHHQFMSSDDDKISTEEDSDAVVQNNTFTDGSKMEQGVG
ncbi:hypothetical protein AVEN_272177-1 [Araneus ventricosus]|uniref:Uncharacterized protein n=1 Tax=Araneus ventricosus TaxID=182803 RepID=A0A4Y2HVP7_ARAVE|nr:hypothetical protein AVEN_272177-1 [Araneus ventricosus]